MRLPTLELGAGDTNDTDFDVRNDIRILPGINHVGDILTLSRDPESHSIVKMNHVIEHFTPQEQAAVVERVYDWLMPGGMFLCWTPDMDYARWAHDNGLISDEHYDNLLHGARDYAENVHLGHLTQDTMRALLAGAGFTVHSVRTVAGSIESVAFKEQDAKTTG